MSLTGESCTSLLLTGPGTAFPPLDSLSSVLHHVLAIVALLEVKILMDTKMVVLSMTANLAVLSRTALARAAPTAPALLHISLLRDLLLGAADVLDELLVPAAPAGPRAPPLLPHRLSGRRLLHGHRGLGGGALRRPAAAHAEVDRVGGGGRS